jgi:hypothetical protein
VSHQDGSPVTAVEDQLFGQPVELDDLVAYVDDAIQPGRKLGVEGGVGRAGADQVSVGGRLKQRGAAGDRGAARAGQLATADQRDPAPLGVGGAGEQKARQPVLAHRGDVSPSRTALRSPKAAQELASGGLGEPERLVKHASAAGVPRVSRSCVTSIVVCLWRLEAPGPPAAARSRRILDRRFIPKGSGLMTVRSSARRSSGPGRPARRAGRRVRFAAPARMPAPRPRSVP